MFEVREKKPSIYRYPMSFISDFIENCTVDLKIRPDIRYPSFRVAGYPATSVSGASLV
jgi:hypothetical protein